MTRICGRKVRVNNTRKKDFFLHRVKKLTTKALTNAPLARHYSFHYKQWQDSSFRAIAKECDGHSLTIIWNAQKRPVWSSRFNPQDKCLSAEQYIWGNDADDGRLIRRILLDESEHPILSKESIYDASGNVTKEIYKGRFTSSAASSLYKENNDQVGGGEEITLAAEYDAKGRKTAECDPLGNWIYFEYENNRDLLTARLTCDQRNIIRREFFSYDAAAICTKSITDDGSARNKDDWSSVSRRTTVRVTPRLSMPSSQSSA